ncbi:MAG TPA: DNA repair protein RecN [Candidatus Limnocylindria bacterium]|nr:DNA repair protein RecN [Candidatus Limnocylindria bacterium]
MLQSLLIRNIALFEQAELTFGNGLHVLTGETGAGKSLVVDAVGFLCGAKADRDIIRTGSDKAYVEGCFLISGHRALEQALAQQELEAEDGVLILSREMTASGRSVYRACGVSVALPAYRSITRMLVDLHGQHEHQSLLEESRHLAYLDLLGGEAHHALMEETRALHAAMADAQRELKETRERQAASRERLDTLIRQRDELSKARLQSGEEEELQQEKAMLRNADRIISALDGASDALQGSVSAGSAAPALLRAQKHLDSLASLDERFSALASRAETLAIDLDELGNDVRRLRGGIRADAGRLEEVEARLDLIRKLERSYGPGIDTMLRRLEDVRAEIAQYEGADERLEQLAARAQEAQGRYDKAARSLSASRREVAQSFTGRIEALLRELNMARTAFFVDTDSDAEARKESGIDRVRMLIAPNAGEEPKPLAKIASGGELSRLMLAMKALTNERNDVPTMVFDEIDTGVSGKTALVIAAKLWDIARYRQVICVTHLHQLASMANVHYQVSKSESGGRTRASARILDARERVAEIAGMLGDVDTQSETSLRHAKTLLKDAAALRERFPLMEPAQG